MRIFFIAFQLKALNYGSFMQIFKFIHSPIPRINGSVHGKLGLPAKAPMHDFTKPAMNLYSPCPAEFIGHSKTIMHVVNTDCSYIDQ